MSTITVKDGRHFSFFQVDNEVIDNQTLSIYAKSPYVVIVRHANRDTESYWIVMETIARKMGKGGHKGREAVRARIKKAGVRLRITHE